MSVLAIIPARSGSKGVPNKNIRMLAGHSLLGWSICACLKSKLIDRIIVSTDSEEYARIALDYGAEVPFLRPKEISQDKSTDFEFIDHLLEWFLDKGIPLPKYLAHIRPTTPYREPVVIDNAIKYFIDSKNATALRSVHEMSESAYKTFEISSSGLLKRVFTDDLQLDSSNSSRQEFPPTYSANGYVDILSVSFIRSNNLIHGDKVIPFITPYIDEIDTEEDMKRLELKLEEQQKALSYIFGDH